MSRKRAKKKAKNQQRPPALSKCKDCGETCRIARYEYFKASRPRCMACGGFLEYGGSWVGARS